MPRKGNDMTKTILIAAALGTTFLASPALAQSDSVPTDMSEPKLMEFLAQSDEFDTLRELIDTVPDVAWFVKEDVAYTIFAPTDAAFAALPEGALDALKRPDNHDALKAILEGHVVPDKVYMSADLSDGTVLDPATGEDIEVSIRGDNVMVAGAQVVQPDIETEQGVVHAIGTVLMPELVADALRQRGVLPAG